MVRVVRSTQLLLTVLCIVSVVLYLMSYLPTRLISITPPLQPQPQQHHAVLYNLQSNVNQSVNNSNSISNVIGDEVQLSNQLILSSGINNAITNSNNDTSTLPLITGGGASGSAAAAAAAAILLSLSSSTALSGGVLNNKQQTSAVSSPSSTISTNLSATATKSKIPAVTNINVKSVKSNIMSITGGCNNASSTTVMADCTLHGVLARSIYQAGHIDANPELCPHLGANIKLLVLIMSAPKHFQARQAIRKTWGHYGMRRDVQIAFLLGSTKDIKMEEELINEQEMYSDLIRAQFVDTYNNLTLKTISMLEWVDNFCPKTTFLLKTDDDMFININRLLAFIDSHKSIPCKKVIYGRLAKKWKPIRNSKSKYYVSVSQYKSSVFPDFTTGPAYLVAPCAVHDLYKAALNHTYLKLEDVFTTGIVAHSIGIKRIHANEFLNKRIAFNPCGIQKAISIHMVKYSEQFDLWKKLLDGKTKCK